MKSIPVSWESRHDFEALLGSLSEQLAVVEAVNATLAHVRRLFTTKSVLSLGSQRSIAGGNVL